VKNLLEEGGDVDEVEPKTLCTPLMLAVRDGSKEIVQLLLDYDADVTRRDKDGMFFFCLERCSIAQRP
jgi:ankyrin repeat protein